MAVGVNFGAQPFQHASFALIHQNAGTAEPVDAAGGTVGGGTGKAGLVLRRKLHLLQNQAPHSQPISERTSRLQAGTGENRARRKLHSRKEQTATAGVSSQMPYCWQSVRSCWLSGWRACSDSPFYTLK